MYTWGKGDFTQNNIKEDSLHSSVVPKKQNPIMSSNIFLGKKLKEFPYETEIKIIKIVARFTH